jgi:hypothetical protein|tara:strand:- start:3639 stop:3851 length:213 start_codon:yes stop_codon:yes gene_type:complete
MGKFKVDEWVLYCAFPEDEAPILSQERKRSVILAVLPKNDFYDYRIYIDGEGKIKKVREHQLFPEAPPTY